jgi:hypothetical protein
LACALVMAARCSGLSVKRRGVEAQPTNSNATANNAPHRKDRN